MSVERCLETCEGGRAWAPSFKTCNVSVLEHRWFSTIKFALDLLQLEKPLSSYWQRQKLAGKSDTGRSEDIVAEGEPAGDDSRKERRHRLAVIDLAVRSRFLWAYTRMMVSVQGALDALTVWAEQCACHPAPKLGMGYCARRFAMAKRFGMLHPCPMRGLRSPELAAGKVAELFAHTSGQHFADLMACLQKSGTSL